MIIISTLASRGVRSTRCIRCALNAVSAAKTPLYNIQTDVSLEAAALRETHEELGILSSQIEILGRLGSAVPSLSGMAVHCFVVINASLFYSTQILTERALGIYISTRLPSAAISLGHFTLPFTLVSYPFSNRSISLIPLATLVPNRPSSPPSTRPEEPSAILGHRRHRSPRWWGRERKHCRPTLMVW